MGITIVCLGLAIAYAIQCSQRYTSADTALAPASRGKEGASSALSQFGGLAAMAGISIPSDSNVEQSCGHFKFKKIPIDSI